MNYLQKGWQKLQDALPRLVDPLFWIPFLVLVIVKLAVFQTAALNYLVYGYHYLYGMNFEVIEGFSDFSAYYLQFVNRFVQGYLPYTEELYAPEGIQVYIYTPLFLYITTLFYFIPAELLFPSVLIVNAGLGVDLTFLRVGFAFVLFDIVTSAIIYIAARQLTTNRAIPVAVMTLFALNPVGLWWGDYMWLSTPIHTLFLVLGFTFMLRDQLHWAALWIALAAMIKQTAGLFLPVILFLELARGRKRLLTSVGIMAAVFLIFSMPYLFLYPNTYLTSITRGMGSYWYYDELPANNYPIPLSILAFYWPEPFKYIAFTVIFYGIPFGGFLAAFWASSWVINQQDIRVYQKQLVTIALLLSLAMHTFWARGIYKYYLIALLPFLLLYGAILHRPLIPLPASLFDQAVSPLDNLMPFHYLPTFVKGTLSRFREYIFTAINRAATWWFLLIAIVSVALYVVHRFVTPAILLALFLSLLGYAWYEFAYKGTKKRKRESKDELVVTHSQT